MGDFFQNGSITTLHKLANRPLEVLERELVGFSRQRPIGLVLPSLISELSGPALGDILEEISKVPYLEEVVIGLDRADPDQFRYAKKFFSRLPQRHQILWNDGARLKALDRTLAEIGLAPEQMGKGRNVWYCYGYVLASGRTQAVALHDCDIVTYSREMLARLCYPVANPSFSFEFCKGYYFRATDESLSGRVCRLLVTPLIRALIKIVGPLEYLRYLDSFRYPLAGEFAVRTEAIKEIRIPSDWGLEIGVLSEIFRHHSHKHLCQVEIADAYDHKHQILSADNPDEGLSKMSIDIAKSIYRKLATIGVVFNKETFRTIKATYYRIALDFIEKYYCDACINGLCLDRHLEEKTVELFAQNIVHAGEEFLDYPMETPFIPCWDRVISAVPDFMDRLREAVELDNAD